MLMSSCQLYLNIVLHLEHLLIILVHIKENICMLGSQFLISRLGDLFILKTPFNKIFHLKTSNSNQHILFLDCKL